MKRIALQCWSSKQKHKVQQSVAKIDNGLGVIIMIIIIVVVVFVGFD